jgi:hypothetical protein
LLLRKTGIHFLLITRLQDLRRAMSHVFNHACLAARAAARLSLVIHGRG